MDLPTRSHREVSFEFSNILSQARVQLMDQAEAAYGKDAGSQPIRASDYLRLLDAFDRLLTFVDEVPAAYDTDFRRNLPAGAWNGLEVASDMKSRIRNVREYLVKHPVYPNAGESLVRNLNACLGLVRHDANVDAILAAVDPVLRAVGAGDLRDARVAT